MQEAECKEAAGLLLKGLLGIVSVLGESWVLRVKLLRKWSCLWPRPALMEDAGAQCELTFRDGVADLSSLLGMGSGAGRQGAAHSWLKALFGTIADRVPTLSMAELLNRCIRRDVLQPLLGQLVVGISRRLEVKIGERAQCKGDATSRYDFTWRDASSDLAKNEVDRHMAQYLCNCRDLFGQSLVFSIATDKGWRNSLPLLNTLIGLPDNHLALAPPQVALSPHRYAPCENHGRTVLA